jgi:hypothetical protein
VAACGQLQTDGLFAVTTGSVGERALTRSGLAVRFLAEVAQPAVAVRELLSTFTSSILALEDVATSAASRPHDAEADIERCRAWLDRPVMQYFTGRGAQRKVLGPWLRYVEHHEALLHRVDSAWDQAVRHRIAELSPDHPLQPLIGSLEIVRLGRDVTDILPEYRTRVASIARECGRVSTEIGILGAVASIALVPIGDVQPWFLVPLSLAVIAYFFGFSIASAVSRYRYRRRRQRPAARARRLPDVPGSVRETILALEATSVQVILGPQMSLGDTAAGLLLWLSLLQRTSTSCPLADVRCSARDDPRTAQRVVLGGPLVRADVEGRRPVVDLSDQRGLGWHFRSSRGFIESAKFDECLAALSLARESADTLFIVGARDIATLRAARRIVETLDGREPRAEDDYWLLGRDRERERKRDRSKTSGSHPVRAAIFPDEAHLEDSSRM